ncbi:phospholipase D-like domain-containing protein [Actinocorallia longicatena]|uniref:phospholipase D n=1 Tax=Actinocorallia longicatena TaxID=111803 RepID=A0ABP6QK52_9ACTN
MSFTLSRRLARRFGALLTALACVPMMILGVAGPAAAAEGSEIILTLPGEKKIEDKLVYLIDGAVNNSWIKIANYDLREWSISNRISDALQTAVDRGVKIQYLGDASQSSTTAYTDLKTKVDNDAHADTWARTCENYACNHTASWTDMHNKFYLFGYTRGTQDVLVQTSANITWNAGGYDSANDAVVLTGADSAGLWAGYWSYFAQLASNANDTDYYKIIKDVAGHAHFHPRASGDHRTSVIDKVDCVAGKSIRITVQRIDDADVITQLRKAQKEGCTVEVITNGYNADEQGGVDALRAAGTSTQSPVSVRDFKRGASRCVHSKYMIIDGAINDTIDGIGYASGKYIFTGSANFTVGSRMGSDETVLRLIKVGDKTAGAIYTDYKANWDALKNLYDANVGGNHLC